jgi:50S ribosomal protein L16 3-hydroxylase
MSPASFMRRHWHRHALLARAAHAGTCQVIDETALFDLAARDDVESRLVIREGSQFFLEHGPFSRSRLRRMPGRDWTLLVQGLDHHVPAAARLLDAFRFVPAARLDDVMVSLAAPGGGVGPHFDSYDVFLLQGPGRRHWRYGPQRDLALDPRQPMKILERFTPRSSTVVNPGDLLYLPPRHAHDGVAIDRCMTFSIGFRAPQAAEIAQGFLEFVADQVNLEGRFADPGRPATTQPGRIPTDLVDWIEQTVSRIHWRRSDIERFAGQFLSTLKPTVFIDPPAQPLSRRALLARIRRSGVRLDPRAIMLYDSRHIHLNGQAVPAPDAGSRRWLRQLADTRRADAPPGSALDDWIHEAHQDGSLLPDES